MGKTLTVFPGNESVDLRDSDNVSQHVTQPLRVHKVEMAERWSGIVEHDTCTIRHHTRERLAIDAALQCPLTVNGGMESCDPC